MFWGLETFVPPAANETLDDPAHSVVRIPSLQLPHKTLIHKVKDYVVVV
jgi:hypothetical protein